MYLMSPFAQPISHPSFLAPTGPALGVSEWGGGQGLPLPYPGSVWGPGNLDLEGEEAAPKQEMPLWAPAARGQGAGFWAKWRLGYMQGKQSCL